MALEKPLLTVPAAGSEIEVIGVVTGYRLSPIVFLMKKGELAAK